MKIFCKIHNNIVYGRSLYVVVMASYLDFNNLLNSTDVDSKNYKKRKHDGEEKKDNEVKKNEDWKMDIEDNDENQDKEDNNDDVDDNDKENTENHENEGDDEDISDNDSSEGDEYSECVTIHGREYQTYAIKNSVHFMPADEVSGLIVMYVNSCMTGYGRAFICSASHFERTF